MPHLYVKTTSPPSSPPSSRWSPPKKSISLFLFIIGFFALGNALIPIINYELRYSSRFIRLISPVSADYYNKKALIDLSAKASGDRPKDYTLISSWFESQPASSARPISTNNITHYTISIPRLKIDQATVEVGGEDLKRSLIQYPETAPPGQLGNPVIFGHSVIPQFFNPKDYMTIFSTLYRLEIGDEIFINYDGVRYRYLVEDIFETQPNDLSVLEQRWDHRSLTLVTCAPAGTYLRRLIIKAQLAQ